VEHRPPAITAKLLTMPELPVEQDDGCILLSFDRMPEQALDHLDPSEPLTASLVVLWHADRCLMVFNRFRQAWELPGGMIDPGESPREAALRELAEESGQQPDALHFVGAARSFYAPARRVESLAVYRGRVAVPAAFTPNVEMSAATWWDPAEPLAGLNPIDAALARLSAE
jgi:8-oxo-dGTP diphosphatase